MRPFDNPAHIILLDDGVLAGSVQKVIYWTRKIGLWVKSHQPCGCGIDQTGRNDVIRKRSSRVGARIVQHRLGQQ